MTSNKSLSIGIITPSISQLAGGLYSSVRLSSQAIFDFGHEISVYSLSDAKTDEALASWKPIKPQVFPKIGPPALGCGKGLRNAVVDHDILHQHGLWQHFSTCTISWRKRNGGPVMISPRGMLDPWALRNSALKKRLANLLYENQNLHGASCIHALNTSEAKSIRAFGLKNPIAVIPNGINLPNYDKLKKPDWWPDKKVILFIGRIHPKKGVFELVESWSHLRRNHSKVMNDWHLVIAGWDDGGHLERLRQKVREYEIDQLVSLPGPIFGDDKHAALQHASAFTLPSFSEGLPMTVLEAWSYGLPVAMTSHCNLTDGFAEGAAHDISTEPNELAAGLYSFLTKEAASLAAMGAKGRELVETQFQWSEIAEEMIGVYRWLKGGGASPSCVMFD